MTNDRPYLLERVDDAAVVQVYADGFDRLTARERVLAWHLAQAALWGRDIYYDQRYRHGLEMRETLEQVLRHPAGVPARVLQEIHRYTKLFWLNSGPYAGLTARKFTLRLAPSELRAAVEAAEDAGAALPVREGETVADLLARLEPAFFDPSFEPLVTNKNPEGDADILAGSANNLYVGMRLADLEGFEERFPLNSRLTRGPAGPTEEVCRVGGRYGAYIARLVAHLEAARALAPPLTARALGALIEWYRSGEDDARRTYDVAWVSDQESPVDTINGFIEVYLDPRGVKGSWEGVVFYVNREKTEGVERIARHAQWFEDHMPWDPRYRRPDVRGVSGRAIDVVVETGDAGPLTAIGINLPNDQAIREAHGSKSVSLANVFDAYERSLPAAYHAEFSWTPDEAERAARWSSVAQELCTHLHEIVGHGSGQVEPRLGGAPQAFLREHYSALEETRADLVSLYFVAHEKMIELDLVPAASFDEIVRAEYEAYTRNALVQLRRVRTGSRLEEDHMRNRQAIVHWLAANTHAVERRTREGKTYLVVTDVTAFRDGVSQLLGEIQRIKAQGDYDAARAFFEAYGVHFEPALRDEIVRRVDALGLPSYTGFVMPSLEPEYDDRGEVVDARLSYPCDLTQQMLDYSAKYCLRPVPWVGPEPPPA